MNCKYCHAHGTIKEILDHIQNIHKTEEYEIKKKVRKKDQNV